MFSPSVLKLLQTIADNDTGDGVLFIQAPCGRWQMDGTPYTVNDRTFHPLAARDLIDIGNGHTDPVKATAAGRAYLAGAAK
ncbi:hypothetical protein ABZX77_09240 [Streptomyces sp. NPDC004237]|uniref:hypothetical protein n=1 Tax=Streptomyces sp. NPDC004237 TaxID=3154455 RepID=UPI0033B28AC8